MRWTLKEARGGRKESDRKGKGDSKIEYKVEEGGKRGDSDLEKKKRDCVPVNSVDNTQHICLNVV